MSFPAVVEDLRRAQRDRDARLRPGAAEEFLEIALKYPLWRTVGRERTAELSHATRATRFTRSLTDTVDIGLRETLDTGDFAGVASGIVALQRLLVAHSLHSPSGTDHSRHLFTAVEACAAGDVDLLRECFPLAAGPTSDGYRFFVVGSNLLYERLWGLIGPSSPAVVDAERYLAAKSHPVMEKKIVAYLLPVVLGDVAGASVALAAIDSVWLSSTWLRVRREGWRQHFSPLLHGLFMVGVEFLADGAELPAPESRAFWPEYYAWLRHPAWTPPERALRFDDDEVAPLVLIYGPYLVPALDDSPAAYAR